MGCDGEEGVEDRFVGFEECDRDGLGSCALSGQGQSHW